MLLKKSVNKWLENYWKFEKNTKKTGMKPLIRICKGYNQCNKMGDCDGFWWKNQKFKKRKRYKSN